jgi:hypothetical protein
MLPGARQHQSLHSRVPAASLPARSAAAAHPATHLLLLELPLATLATLLPASLLLSSLELLSKLLLLLLLGCPHVLLLLSVSCSARVMSPLPSQPSCSMSAASC